LNLSQSGIKDKISVFGKTVSAEKIKKNDIKSSAHAFQRPADKYIRQVSL